MDNFKGQTTPFVTTVLEENNTHECLLPPNPTDRLQPLDAAVNKPAKEFYRKKLNFRDGTPGKFFNRLKNLKGVLWH